MKPDQIAGLSRKLREFEQMKRLRKSIKSAMDAGPDAFRYVHPDLSSAMTRHLGTECDPFAAYEVMMAMSSHPGMVSAMLETALAWVSCRLNEQEAELRALGVEI